MRVLQIEFIKLLRPSTYILFSILLLLFCGLAAVQYKIHEAQDITLILKNVDSSQISIIFTIFSIFVIMNIGSEYTESTLRRSVIEGYTRDEFFQGKLLLIIVSAIFLLLVQKAVFLISAAITDNYQAGINYLTPQVLTSSLLKIIYYGVFALFLTFLTRSVAVSIVIVFVWVTMEEFLLLFLKYKHPELEWSYYLPMSALDSTLKGTDFIPIHFLLVPVAYQLVMLLSSYWLLLKRDLK